MARQGRGAGLADAGIEVGDRVLVTAGFGLLRGPAAELGLDPARRFGGEGVVDFAGRDAFELVRAVDEDPAAAALEPEVVAVAVEVLGLAGEVGQGVEELAVVGPAGAELVVDRLVAGRDQDLGRAEAEAVELRQGDRLALLGGAGEAGRRFGQQPGDAAALLARRPAAGPARATVSRPRSATGSSATAGRQRDRVGAQRRQGAVEVDQRGARGFQGRGELLDRRFEVGRLVARAPR